MPEQARPAPAPREPDSSRAFALLLKLGMDPGDAYAFVQEVQSMAAENLINRFESRQEALAARVESKLDALASEVSSIKWFIGAAAIFAILVIALVQLLLVARGVG